MRKRDWLSEAAYRELWEQHRNSTAEGEMRRLESDMSKLQVNIEKTGEAHFMIFVNNLPGHRDYDKAQEAIAARKIRLGV